jgi:hypothetical protein
MFMMNGVVTTMCFNKISNFLSVLYDSDTVVNVARSESLWLQILAV